MNYDELTDRELDALVAEKVMGLQLSVHWRGAKTYIDLDNPSAHYKIPHYSSNINDAFEVVEAMRERGTQVSITNFQPEAEWQVTFELVKMVPSVCSESLPRAICIAALRALDNQESTGCE